MLHSNGHCNHLVSQHASQPQLPKASVANEMFVDQTDERFHIIQSPFPIVNKTLPQSKIRLEFWGKVDPVIQLLCLVSYINHTPKEDMPRNNDFAACAHLPIDDRISRFFSQLSCQSTWQSFVWAPQLSLEAVAFPSCECRAPLPEKLTRLMGLPVSATSTEYSVDLTGVLVGQGCASILGAFLTHR